MRNPVVYSYFLVSMLLVSILSVIVTVPALATESGKAMLKILDTANAEANNELREFQQKQVEIPSNADSLYSDALSEHQAAAQALDAGDISSARVHALKAMDQYKALFDLLSSLEPDDRKADLELVNEINEEILDSRKVVDNLRKAVNANNISLVNFSSYDSTINASLDALSEGNLRESREQLDIAHGLLDDLHDEIQKAIDSNKDERAREFALKTADRLGMIITDLKDENSTDFQIALEELERIVEELENETDFEKIIEITDDSGALQAVIDEYNAHRVENFDEDEQIEIEEQIAALYAAAEELNLRIDGSEVDKILNNIRENINSDHEDQASEELDRLDSLLDEIEEFVQDFSSMRKEIEEVREIALRLSSQNQDNAAVQEQINKAISLIQEADTILLTAAEEIEIGPETINTMYAHLQSATELIDEAEDILDETEEGNEDSDQEATSSQSLMETISDYEDWANDLRAEALEENNTEALELVDKAISLIGHARDSASEGDVEQAESYLNDAQVHLENAEDILKESGEENSDDGEEDNSG